MKVLAVLCLYPAMSIFGAPVKRLAPPTAPSIGKPNAGEKTIEGKADDAKYQIRVKVFGESGELQHRDALVDQQDKTFGVALKTPLAAGQIVQAFLLVNGVETAPSIPVAVLATAAAPGAMAAALLSDPCVASPANTVLAQPSIESLTTDDTEIKGNPVLGSGTVSVCVNGALLNVKDSASGTPGTSIPFKNGTYDAFFDSGQLKEGNGVVVVITSADKKQRLTAFTQVKPSTKLPADVCVAPDNKLAPITLHPALEDGSTTISGTSPLADGALVACLNGKALALTDKADNTVKQGAFSVNVKNSFHEGNTIDLLVTSADGKTRVKTSFDVGPVKFTEVELSATPKEGQKTIYVNASPSGTVNYSLAAFVNGEQVRVIDSSGNETDSVPTSSTGATAVQLKDPIDGGQCVQVVEFETGKHVVPRDTMLGCGGAYDPSDHKDYYVSKPKTAVAFFDFGRIRSYFVVGSLLSFDGGNFSQPSVFMALNASRNWIWGGIERKPDGNKMTLKRHRFMFDTFFEARLTTLPTAACTQTGTQTSTVPAAPSEPAGMMTSPAPATTPNGCSSQQTTTTGAGTSMTTTPTLQSVLTSPKAGELLAGISAPVILSTWTRGTDPYGFSLGPIAKIGFLTPVGSQGTETTQPATPQSFYTNFGFGARFGFHKLTYSSDVAPETVSYIDVVTGRYNNFDFNPDPTKRYSRPWRFAFEGLLKLPSTPFFLGFSANIHQNFGLGGSNTVDHARDDLRFLFGAKFDAGKLFDALGQIK